MNLPGIALVVLAIHCGFSLVEPSAMVSSTCIANPTDHGWILYGKLQRPCQWDFTMTEGQILIVNILASGMDRVQIEDCLKLQGKTGRTGSLQQIPISSAQGEKWCFSGHLSITYIKNLCPASDPTHGLHLDVQVAHDRTTFCEDKTQWMYKCGKNSGKINVVEKIKVRGQSCVPKSTTTEPSDKSTKPSSTPADVTEENITGAPLAPRSLDSVGKQESNEEKTGTPSLHMSLYAIVLIVVGLFMVMIVGLVIYLRAQHRTLLKVAKNNERVALENALPYLRTGHDYEAMGSYITPVPSRRDMLDSGYASESQEILLPIYDGDRDSSTGSSGLTSSGETMPNTFIYLEQPGNLNNPAGTEPVSLVASTSTDASTTAVKSLVDQDGEPDMPSVETVSSTRVFW